MGRKRIIAIIWLAATICFAEAPRFNTAKTLPPPSREEILSGAKKVNIPDDLKVPESWAPYLNPAFDTFWLDNGNHYPDPGFVLFARNPSPETARLWLIRMETKAQLLTDMWEFVEVEYKQLLSSGVIKDRYGILKNTIASNLTTNKLNIGKTQIYFLFSSSCGACKKQADILRPLANSVMPLQVDDGPLKHFQGFRKSEKAEPQTIKDYVKDTVPLLLISNREAGKIQELQGVQSIDVIMKGVAYVTN